MPNQTKQNHRIAKLLGRTALVAFLVSAVLIGALVAAQLLNPAKKANEAGTYLNPQGPLVITEVMCSNSSYAQLSTGEYCDWVEIQNTSDETVNLADYCLSDKQEKLSKRQMPSYALEPGACVIIYCDDDKADAETLHMNFGLSVTGETLYLARCVDDANPEIIDTIAVPADTPIDGSYGREQVVQDTAQSSKTTWALRYYSAPTPGQVNAGGSERVCAEPTPAQDCAAGTYDGVENVTVTLSATDGDTIFYTTDASVPAIKVSTSANGTQTVTAANSSTQIYTQPIVLESTTVLRVVAASPDAITSRVNTLSYFINEEHTLPVLSFVTNDADAFWETYNASDKTEEHAGNLALYEDGQLVWESNCGAFLKGFTGLTRASKTLGFAFRGKYGDGDLCYDVFDSGVSVYSSISARNGQDNSFAVIRNELVQDLILESDSELLTQHSKYCSLYIDGQYWGLYCLKEDLNANYFANLMGLDKEDIASVPMMDINLNANLAASTDAQECREQVFIYADKHDMTDANNYAQYCEMVDIDSLIDYLIFEGWCANSDTLNNHRFYKVRDGGKWKLCLYDVDWAFYYQIDIFGNVLDSQGNSSIYMNNLTDQLFKNAEFRAKFLTRYAYLSQVIISNEHALEKSNELAALIRPEMTSNQARWGSTMSAWDYQLDKLNAWFTDIDLTALCKRNITRYCNVTQAEWDAAYAAAQALINKKAS